MLAKSTRKFQREAPLQVARKRSVKFRAECAACLAEESILDSSTSRTELHGAFLLDHTCDGGI